MNSICYSVLFRTCTLVGWDTCRLDGFVSHNEINVSMDAVMLLKGGESVHSRLVQCHVHILVMGTYLKLR